MASVCLSLQNPAKCVVITGVQRPTTHLSVAVRPIFFNPQISPILRLKRRKQFSAVYASNTNPKEEDSLVETPDEIKAGQGPPFLTILAGFVVIFLVGWIVWSILTSLIGLIVSLFYPK